MKFAIYNINTGLVRVTGSVPKKDIDKQELKTDERIFIGKVNPRRERINLDTLQPELIPNIDEILAEEEAARDAAREATDARNNAHRNSLQDIADGNVGNVVAALERIAQAILDRGY